MIPPSKTTLSPRELGRALGVSESSVKRWIDDGRVPARRTSGGHRRIELLPALRFIRGSGRAVADPGALGIPAGPLSDPGVLEERIFEHLTRGRRSELQRDLLVVLGLGAVGPADLFDGPLRSAMSRIGELWRGDHRGIFVEHRATQIVLRGLDGVRALYETPEEGPGAVGGSISGDPGLLPTRMAATVLCWRGYDAVDLGADTPPEALLEAVDQLGARLVWLSVGHAPDTRRLIGDVERLLDGLGERGTPCVLGGREIRRLPPSVGKQAYIGQGMRDLARFAGRFLRENGSERNGTT